MLRLGMAYDALREAYRRIVFNVMAINQDDHVKNLPIECRNNRHLGLTRVLTLDIPHIGNERVTSANEQRVLRLVVCID